MPLELPHDRVIVLIRQSAFERSGLTRKAIDERYNLTDEEFRVEDGLIALGPLPSDDMLPELVEDLEASGLVYFDEFFELSGNWPDWLSLYARGLRDRGI
ncbi:MAG: hypothetical protein DMD30_07850 [Gemmatimonadetes bacterium]|nr:MAG: hypothetical protein DMD30_07850 [Gemmatimonadota bacterium]PYP53104.1 MAG: hypothetical protein DMD39_05885 [Gemmatimonadota bacterium]